MLLLGALPPRSLASLSQPLGGASSTARAAEVCIHGTIRLRAGRVAFNARQLRPPASRAKSSSLPIRCQHSSQEDARNRTQYVSEEWREGSSYDYPPPPGSRTARPPPTPPSDPKGGGSSSGGGGPNSFTKALIAGAFILGMGAGVGFNSTITFQPNNVASTEIIDRKTPSSEVCIANGYSSMVFDQRIFVSFNPFNVYVTQPEVKPGCVLRRSNVGVLEREKLVTDKEVNACKRNMNTFAFVGDLTNHPEVSCVYHSEDAENQFLRNPQQAAMGDGYQPRLPAE